MAQARKWVLFYSWSISCGDKMARIQKVLREKGYRTSHYNDYAPLLSAAAVVFKEGDALRRNFYKEFGIECKYSDTEQEIIDEVLKITEGTPYWDRDE